MARLYADEDIPRPLIDRLRDLGHDIVSVSELRRSGRPDEQVLQDAIADTRIVVTHNRPHFSRLHKSQPNHTGIISCSRDEDSEALADRIHAVLNTTGDLAGLHIRVNRPSAPEPSLTPRSGPTSPGDTPPSAPSSSS